MSRELQKVLETIIDATRTEAIVFLKLSLTPYFWSTPSSSFEEHNAGFNFLRPGFAVSRFRNLFEVV
jgi:hypothetical protein